jgi:hypothetical protein
MLALVETHVPEVPAKPLRTTIEVLLQQRLASFEGQTEIAASTGFPPGM